MKRITKIGYVRLVDRSNNILTAVSYEELLLNRRSFSNLYSAKSYYGGRLYCCCRNDDSAFVDLKKDRLSFPDIWQHSDECIAYFPDALVNMKAGAFSDTFSGKPLKVSFDWGYSAKKTFKEIKRSDMDTLTDMKRLDLPAYIICMNICAFSYRYGTAEKPQPKNEMAHSRIFADTVRRFGLSNKRESLDPRHDFFYYPNMPSGIQRFYYGKLSGFATKSVSENSPYRNIYLSPMVTGNESLVYGRYGTGPMVRVRKADFDPVYDSLFDKDSVYICGFIRSRDVPTDTSDISIPSMPINPGIRETRQADLSICVPTKLIYEMRICCLFVCNDAGMIVFSKEELDASNRLLRENRLLYRPLFQYPDCDNYTSRFPLLVSSENYLDEEAVSEISKNICIHEGESK